MKWIGCRKKVILVSFMTAAGSEAFVMTGSRTKSTALFSSSKSRRSFVQQSIRLLGGAGVGVANVALADEPAGFDVDNFLKTGAVAMPMGVSGQAGKGKPELGVVLRDGSEVSRDARTGDVLAEILVRSGSNADELVPVLAGFSSPWSLQSTDTVECRDSNTGDGAFLALSPSIPTTTSTSLKDVSPSFLMETLFSPTGRFSFYGEPTNVKVKKNIIMDNNDDVRILEITFSTLSQSTQTEIPRNAIVAFTIPKGTQQAVMLVASSNASRWKKGSETTLRNVISTFRAIPAPPTNLKVRAKTT